uniref:EF-hand domain-containing protein n=1 Tax=Anopheles dirus TaxID=7168 RepID=A0A182N5S0_9DIPT
MSSKSVVFLDEKFPVEVEVNVCPFRVSSQSSVVDDGEAFEAIEDPHSRLLESSETQNDPQTSTRWYGIQSFVFGATKFRIAEELLKFVEENPLTNVELDLSRRGYTNLHVQIALDALLKARPACVTRVDLCRNRLFNSSLVQMLGNVLQELQTIAFLSVSYNMLDDECIGILSEALSNSGVRAFEATHCQISDRGGERMFSSMVYSDCIEVIDLSWNHLEINSGVAIGRFLSNQKTMRELILVGNHLYNEAQCIVPFLLGAIGNESLDYLDLSWNSLRGEDFSRALLKAIPQTKLKRFKLEHNLLANVEMSSIVRMMKRHESLEQVWLGGNVIEDEIATDLVRAFGRHPTLQLLSLGSFHFVSQPTAKLGQLILRQNPSKHIIYQGVLMANPARPVDVQEMLLERCRFLAQKPKKAKQKRDFGHLMLQFAGAESKTITREEFELAVKRFRVKLDRPLLGTLMDAFQASKSTVDTGSMAEKYLTKHPTEPPVLTPRKGKAKKIMNAG